ncbi:hypothetical protein J6I82_05350 [Acinetobacter baumannii]|uniref:Uncharacterized protein n=1 Tax=Acinetobacter baumannii TaxID=470 RepID=A0A1Y1P956_ACIBA|nr:hypothetical protein [Acinetobacter baumannii]KMV03158.1 putative membrane protein [Acinetobacter baumannii]KMV09169.1 putative membrane protein [Acinetobacter baumannii]MCA4424341.1 hypothetical protein [Acinetobacter baumannii]MCG6615659.1 hypothetical protein [Acinetobacter baumannii]MEE1860670.1 hypothetical protein [Acinetobacter baumannii]
MNGENTRTYLAFAAIAISFFCVIGLFFIEMPEKNRDLINVALGAILGWSGTVVAFYFGSSDKQRKEVIGNDDIR